MGLRFRQFAETFGPFSLREEEAAPALGSAPAVPDNPDNADNDKTNKHHWDSLQRQFGIDDKAFDAVIEQGILDIWRVPDYSQKWGFLVNGSCSARAEKLPSDNYKVTFMLRIKKSQRPFDFFLPYGKDGGPLRYYDGPVDDKTEIMTREELQDAMAEPWKNGGAAPPGGGMGGAPPGGPGGMPPAGGPPPGGM